MFQSNQRRNGSFRGVGAESVTITSANSRLPSTGPELPVTLSPPPQTLPKAPVLKTLGCASTAKVNQLIACQSDGAPGDANSPVTLLEWHAPGGIPDVGFDGIVFLTKFPNRVLKNR